MIVWLKKTKQIYDRIFNRNWPVPFLAVLINLVSGEFQAGFKILKQNKHDEEHGPDRSMMSFTAYFYFRWCGSFECRKLYHLY